MRWWWCRWEGVGAREGRRAAAAAVHTHTTASPPANRHPDLTPSFGQKEEGRGRAGSGGRVATLRRSSFNYFVRWRCFESSLCCQIEGFEKRVDTFFWFF